MTAEDARLEALKAAVAIAPKGVANAGEIVLGYARTFEVYLTTGAMGSTQVSVTPPRGAARSR